MRCQLIPYYHLSSDDLLNIEANHTVLTDTELYSVGASRTSATSIRQALEQGETFYCCESPQQPLVLYSKTQRDYTLNPANDAGSRAIQQLQSRFPFLNAPAAKDISNPKGINDPAKSFSRHGSTRHQSRTATPPPAYHFNGNNMDDGEPSARFWLSLYFYQDDTNGKPQPVEGVPYTLSLKGSPVVHSGITPADGRVRWDGLRPYNIRNLSWGQPHTTEYIHEQYTPLNDHYDIKIFPSLPISLHYNDVDSTPAGSSGLGKVPYKVTFANGEVRTACLNNKGRATEYNCASDIHSIEYYPDDDINNTQQALEKDYLDLEQALNQCANTMAAGDIAAANTLAQRHYDLLAPDKKADLDFYQALVNTAQAHVSELRALADIHNAKPFYERLAANIHAAKTGADNGITGYIPDFGEMLADINIDPSVLMSALATGDISELEKQFQQWPKRAEKGFEAASESMEVLILLLSDPRARELIMSLPARYLEAMPDPQLVTLTASQGMQTTLDIGATTAATAVGGPAGTALIGSLALLRKGGKAAEGMIKILNKLVKKLKILKAKQKTKNSDEKVLLEGYNDDSASIPTRADVPKGKRGATNNANKIKLEKQLASQEQLGQLSSGGGTVISQPAKQANRIASQTGRNPENIQKVSSDARVARDGQQVQSHSFRDASTNELIQPKTIIAD